MVNTFLHTSFHSIEVLPQYLNLRLAIKHQKILEPHISLNTETDSYVIKTADTAREYYDVLRLRCDVFHREFAERSLLPFLDYDIDHFDLICDHLIVKEKKSDRVVACYRLLALTEGRKITKCYSQTEFNIDELLALPGNKVELGRAAVHRDFRNGTVIGLLWKGLCQYAHQAKAKYLFGCSSISAQDLPYLGTIKSQLQNKDAFLSNTSISPLLAYNISKMPRQTEKVPTESKLSSLINMYLLAGAKLSPHFAYDPGLRCVDMFTYLDFENIPASFRRRFC